MTFGLSKLLNFERGHRLLKPYLLEVFEECYQDGLEIASKRSQIPIDIFPKVAIANLDQVLHENWLP